MGNENEKEQVLANRILLFLKNILLQRIAIVMQKSIYYKYWEFKIC